MRIHFSRRKLKDLRPFVHRQGANLKPSGFWYSIEGKGDGWSDWCKAEEYAIGSLEFAAQIEIDESKVLMIRSVPQLDSFHHKYRASDDESYAQHIFWSRVAAEWSGIEISPYLYDRRCAEGFLWYYGWDCASGCIWDSKAILSIASAVLKEEK